MAATPKVRGGQFEASGDEEYGKITGRGTVYTVPDIAMGDPL